MGIEDAAMRWILLLWALPITILGTWYGLSINDINFGYLILSRQMNEFVFQLYGQILGIPAADIPGLVARAIVLDSIFLFSFLAFRRRKAIAAWWKARQASPVVAALPIDDSLSSAP